MENLKKEEDKMLLPVFQVFAWTVDDMDISVETHRFTSRDAALDCTKELQIGYDNVMMAENYKQIAKMWKYIGELHDELCKPEDLVHISVQEPVVESKGKEKKNAKA